MAEQAETVYGGHDNDFVIEVADRFMCQVCTKVLREPHLAVCCGQHFCESCLNKWFDRQQGRRSCPHCRAEGDTFSHVINKGLRSEINQLNIWCSNRGEGCKWTGELGTLKRHLESEIGCGFVEVECPNRCQRLGYNLGTRTMKRKDLYKHLTHKCYLRPYQCEFCGLKDTYKAITGIREIYPDCEYDPYFGHQAECPEAPLTCSNQCGLKRVKRKDMENHRSECPHEDVECPFAEAGCKIDVIRRHQLEDHMTSSLQQHLTMVMKDYKETKREFRGVKEKLQKAEVELSETKDKLNETDSRLDEAVAKLSVAEDHIAWSNKLGKEGDSTTVKMANFSEYRRSGKVWYSPPFYYGEGYKMCLAVYTMEYIGQGAVTDVSVSLYLLRGRFDDQLKWPIPCTRLRKYIILASDGYQILRISKQAPLQRPEFNEICPREKICYRSGKAIKLLNDCLTLDITHLDDYHLKVKIA